MKSIRATLALVFLFTGCDNGTSTTGGGDAGGGALTGTLQGRVKYSITDSIVEDHSGISVTLEGTSFSTTTDIDGHWEIENLPTRNYTVVYSKVGFGTIKLYSVLFIGGGIVDLADRSLTLVPECSAELDAVREDAPGHIFAYAHTLCPTSRDKDQVIFFFSNSPNVSSTNYDRARYGNAQSGGAISVNLSEPNGDFLDLNTDDSIYVVAYHASGGQYYDPTIRRNIYTSLHPQPSRTLSILLDK